MATPLGNAEWWHRHAEQCRARADKFEDPIIRERMLMIADGYDRIAHDAEKIEAKNAVQISSCPHCGVSLYGSGSLSLRIREVESFVGASTLRSRSL